VPRVEDLKVTATHDNVVIERLGPWQRSSMLEVVEDKPPLEIGRVQSVGPGFAYFGFDQELFRSPMDVAEGDLVIFGRYAGADMGEKRVVLKHGEILGVYTGEWPLDGSS
jgi:co-chaperonin GroES (HSP10)